MSNQPKIKSRLHQRNRNREPYDLKALQVCTPELSNYLKPNKYGAESVDFAHPKAVKALNKALLNHYYGIENWDFPDENLTPPIPGRADYIHYLADLLCEHNYGKFPEGNKITCYDIGTGASCIYPILGVTEYDWNFIGSDIEPKSIESATKVIAANPTLTNKIECRLQENPKDLFYGIIGREDKIDLSMCNPPFHASAEEALKGTKRKLKNLGNKDVQKPDLNFAGVSNELITDGGEHRFVHKMIRESSKFGKNCYWFSTLVSKKTNIPGFEKLLQDLEAKKVRIIPMGTGNKSSHVVAWTFLSKEERIEWTKERWKAKN